SFANPRSPSANVQRPRPATTGLLLFRHRLLLGAVALLVAFGIPIVLTTLLVSRPTTSLSDAGGRASASSRANRSVQATAPRQSVGGRGATSTSCMVRICNSCECVSGLGPQSVTGPTSASQRSLNTSWRPPPAAVTP